MKYDASIGKKRYLLFSINWLFDSLISILLVLIDLMIWLPLMGSNYYLKPTDPPAPRFYGQPKMHKSGVCICPVVFM